MKAGDGAGGQDPLAFQISTDQNVKMFIGDQSDKSGTVMLDSTETIVSNELQLWTVKLAGSGAAVIRKNGDPSSGVANGSGKDHTYAFDVNANHLIEIGAHVNGLRMYEIILFNERLSNGKIVEVERQLKQKYKLDI
jgi:hypothetical protein